MGRGLSALIDFGTREGMRAARVSTVRSLNVVLGTMCVITALTVIASALMVSTILAVINVLFLLCYLIAFLLNGAQFHTAARYVMAGVGGIHFLVANICLGNQSGLYIYAVAYAFAPIMIFSRSEWRQLLAVLAWFVVTVIASQAYLIYRGPVYTMSPQDLEIARAFTLAMVCLFAFATVYYYRASAVAAQIRLYNTNQRLHELLANMLPQLIADRLERGETLIADSHAEATVLFADLVGFSGLSHRLSPSHLVELLNDLFSQFDEAASQHGVEKIKTIGDCYMAASGILGETGCRVEGVADFALDMIRIVRSQADASGLPLEIRIGISTGPVISGVIGRRKYAYDLWGDTVNLASRMESGGERGHIQVTEATYWRLCRRYRLEKRGEINVKGYPNTVVYDLLGPHETDESTTPPSETKASLRLLRS